MSGFYLEPIAGSNSGQGIPFPTFKAYTCGRQRTNDIMFNSVTVSREHCLFMVAPNHFQVFDHQSANGTYIDGQRVTAKTLHTLRIGHILGVSCHKVNEAEFEQEEKRFVFRLQRLPADFSNKKLDNKGGNFTKEEVGDKRKSNGDVSPVPCKVARIEIDDDDDCVVIENEIQPEPRPAIVNPSTSAPQDDNLNTLIKYELDIPEENLASEDNLINERVAVKESAANSSKLTPNSVSRVDELSAVKSSSSFLNDDANSSDMFSDSPVSSPKDTAKETNVSVIVKTERKSTEAMDVTGVIEIDDDDVVFPASQLFGDDNVSESSEVDNTTSVNNPTISSIIKEECDLGTDNIACYNEPEVEEHDESEYPLIILSDDDDECENPSMNPWFLKLSGSQLENRSELEASKLEASKCNEEPKENMEIAHVGEDIADEDVDGLLDSINDMCMDIAKPQVSEEVTISDSADEVTDQTVTDDTDSVSKVEELPVDLPVVITASVPPEIVQKTKKDKKDKGSEHRHKESRSKSKDKSKSRKSEKSSKDKAVKKPIDAYELKELFEELPIESYQSTKKDEKIKKNKGIVIRSNVEIKTPIKSIVADKQQLLESSNQSKDDKNKKRDEKDSKDDRKDKGGIKKRKDVPIDSKDREKVKKKVKRLEKGKDLNKHKKKEIKGTLIPFEEALQANDKLIVDDKKKIKKRKTSEESNEEPKMEPVASTSDTSSVASGKESPKAEPEPSKILVIDGRKVSISTKVEKKIKTIPPPIFIRGGRHGVSGTVSASSVLNNTPKVPDVASSPNDSDNQEDDSNAALFSKPEKLTPCKSDNPMEQQKRRLKKTFREHEIRTGVNAISKAIAKRENQEMVQDRRERLKQLAVDQRKAAENNNSTTKRINKPRVKVSKNRGGFLCPDVDLDAPVEDSAKVEPVEISKGPTFDLHVEVVKTNHINANPTAVDDLSDVISTNSVPGYPEPRPQEEQDTESDSSHDIDSAMPYQDINMSPIDGDSMDIDPDPINSGPSTSFNCNYSAPSTSYSPPARAPAPPYYRPVKQVYSKPQAIVRPSNDSFRLPKSVRGILKKRGQANHLLNGLASNNLPQIGRPKKNVRFVDKGPEVYLFQIPLENKLVRKCTQKDAAMPKRPNTLPGDPSIYLPNVSNLLSSKELPALPAPAPTHHNASTSRHNIGGKVFEPRRISGPQLDEFLLRIFEWNPQWLDSEAYNQKEQEQLPIVSEGPMPCLSAYSNYTDYYSIMSDLMLLEMWADILRKANEKEYLRQKAIFGIISENSITQTPIRSTKLMATTFTIEILCYKKQHDNKQYPVPGSLVMLELPLVVDNQIHLRPIFAYVKDLHKSVITPSSMPPNIYLLKQIPNPYAVITLRMMTKSLPLNIRFNRVLRIKNCSYIRSNLRMVQSVQHLSSNPLLNCIIQPKIGNEVYKLPTVLNTSSYKFTSGDDLNDKQKETVVSITNAMVETKPRICLVEGPPGTGKSRVITNIITEILYGQNRYSNNDKRRILVCAPSNAAVDEITMRLADIRAKIKRENSQEPFRLVRVGYPKVIHPKVQEYSLDKLVEKSLCAKGPGDASADNEIIRLNESITQVEFTMETCSIPEDKRNDLKKKLDNWYAQRKLLLTSKQARSRESEKRPYLENKILTYSDVITCTLSSCYSQCMELAFGDRSSKKISMCIIDEATQSTEPETLIPLMLGVHKFVLVGDPQQLPATVISSKAKELNYDKSLFSRIQERFMTELENPIMSLNTQYRMSHPICYFPNGFFYKDQLQSSVKPVVWPYAAYKVFNLSSVQDNNIFSNSDEAAYVVNLIHTIMTRANLDRVEGIIRIGVITPYQDQRKLVNTLLKNKLATVPDYILRKFSYDVSTVDGFQGQEREIIIMSCVRSNGIGFLSDRQRLCVALTRAKHSLFLCGNFKTFERDETWSALIKDARSRNFYIPTDHKADEDRIKHNIVKLGFIN